MKKNKISKAIIPAAGLGTRLYPISRAIPKELFPIGNRSVIEYVIHEGVLSGLREFLIVISKEKEVIKDYILKLQTEGKFLHNTIEPELDIRFNFIYQKMPTGLGDAILISRKFTSDKPFAVLLPDNIYPDNPPATAQLIDTFEAHESPVLGTSLVSEELEDMFEGSGRFDYEFLDSKELVIKKIYDKKTVFENSTSKKKFKYRGRGRYILAPDFYEHLEKMKPIDAGDYDEIPALQSLIKEKMVIARVIDGRTFDTGTPEGYAYMIKNMDITS